MSAPPSAPRLRRAAAPTGPRRSYSTLRDAAIAAAMRVSPLRRAILHAARLAYDGASRAQRLAHWSTSSSGPRAEIAAGGATLRARSHELCRNNTHIAKARQEWVTHIVGAGIVPRADTGDAALDERIDALWEAWGRECYPSSALGIYGLQRLAASAWWESGEVLLRRRLRRTEDGLTVPLQVELLEPDYLDESRDGTTQSGRRVVGGIEFDALGRRVAYWLYPEHPGESWVFTSGSGESKRIKARDIAHLYEETRPGQVRGVPYIHPSMLRAWELDGYQDAETMRARLQATLVATVHGDRGLAAPIDEDGNPVGAITDASGALVEDLSPGSIIYAPDGTEIDIHQPTQVPGYKDFAEASVRAIAAGIGMPYELVSGDLSGVNYSSIRYGSRGWESRVSALQQTVFIPLALQPIREWWLDLAELSGQIPILPDGRQRRCQWSIPERQPVDAYKEAGADERRIANGTHSRIELIRARGREWQQVLSEEQRYMEERRRLGLDDAPSASEEDGA